MLKLLLTSTALLILTSACANTKKKPIKPMATQTNVATANPAATVPTDAMATKGPETSPAAPTVNNTNTAASPTTAGMESAPVLPIGPLAGANAAPTMPAPVVLPPKEPTPTQTPGQNVGSASPTQIRITNVSFVGTGCPRGTLGGTVSADTRVLTLNLAMFGAIVGPQVPPASATSTCLVGIEFDVPANISFTLLNLDIRGYLSLSDKVKLTLQNRFFFSERSNQVQTLSSEMSGPAEDNFNAHRPVSANQIMWSTCGAARKQILFFETSAILNNDANKAGEGLVSVDSIEGDFIQKLSLDWKACSL